jgi:hypothetical protein
METLKKGTLVSVMKNDMSLVIRKGDAKDSLFFNSTGTILTVHEDMTLHIPHVWYDVLFPSGIYCAREDAIASLEGGTSESR